MAFDAQRGRIMRIIAALSACAAVLLVATTQAEAQTPPPAAAPEAQPQARPKPRRAAGPKKNAMSVTITNNRTETLQDFQITTSGATPIVVAKLAKPLAPGKSATLAIKGKHGCLFDISGAYADESTVENDGHDLCKDSKLRLSE